MVIDVVALTYETVEYVRSEPYQTIYCTDSTLAPGEEQVLTPGREGSVHCTARITRENGTEVSRTVTQERVLYAPVNAVVARGIDRSSKEQLLLLGSHRRPDPEAGDHRHRRQRVLGLCGQ